MRSPSQHFALRARPEDIDRLRQIREVMQAKHQHATVTLADAFSFAVSTSYGVAVAPGTPLPDPSKPRTAT